MYIAGDEFEYETNEGIEYLTCISEYNLDGIDYIICENEDGVKKSILLRFRRWAYTTYWRWRGRRNNIRTFSRWYI